MKPRILFCNEFSKLKTGYAIYGYEVLSRLYNSGKYDLYELGSYVHYKDQRAQNYPWILYSNMPDQENEEQLNRYNSDAHNQFGAWRFEEVCVDCFPHIVADIRDFWMHSYQYRSPFRPYFNHVVMPTVDAYPQNEEWISSYETLDGVFTYQDWSTQVLDFESANKIKTLGSAPPAADSAFQPMNREEIKKMLGMENVQIIGTVMRNQRRKLFPDLFGAFKIFLEQTKIDNVLLYCHTSFPDMGWDIPKLLLQYGIASKVLFTYICKACGAVTPNFFNDAIIYCPKCNKLAAGMSNVQTGVDNKSLAAIMNTFDLYIQWSNCLTPGQKIKTGSGWKNIEDIQTEELVLTHTGQYQKVINTFKHQNNNQVYEIDVHGDYETLKLTAEHPAYVVDREKVLQNNETQSLREVLGKRIKNALSYNIPCKFVEAKHLQDGDLLVEKIDQESLNVSKIDLGWCLDDHQLCCKPEYIYNDQKIAIRLGDFYNRYIEIDNDFCRFFGLYIADGTASYDKSNKNVRICCNINEQENINLAKEVLWKISNKEPSIREYKDRQAVNVESYSALHGAWFMQFGKLENKCFPNWVLRLPIEKQKNVVYGMFMGDGCYLEDKNVSIYVTISEKLAAQLKELLQRIGLTYNVNKIIKHGKRKPQYRFEVRGNVKNGKFDCDRNSTRSLNYNGYYLRSIKTIKKIEYNGPVYNIEVENDNSYTSKITVLHNSEGYGMPLVEAAACGVPVIAVDYSAMSDTTRKMGGVPIKPLALSMELETGCFRAIPDNDALINKLIHFFKNMSDEEKQQLRYETRQNYLKHYSWDATAKKWADYFDSIDVEDYENRWRKEPQYINIPSDYPKNISNKDFARWLIINVLGEPRFVNSYMESRLIRDLNYGVTSMGISGMYFNDHSAMFSKPQWSVFSKENAFKHFTALGNRRNYWENMRWKKVKQEK